MKSHAPKRPNSINLQCKFKYNIVKTYANNIVAIAVNIYYYYELKRKFII